MARIKYSGLITEIRGSVGGTTFQSNRYGFTVKNKPNMILPDSITQNRSKLIMQKASKDWEATTDLTRSNWNTFAATFPQYALKSPTSQLSGREAFVKWHCANYLGIGLDTFIRNTPTTVMPEVDTLTASLAVSAPYMNLTTSWALETGFWYANLFLSRPLKPSQVFIGSITRFIVNTSNVNDVISIGSEYLGVFGILPSSGDVLVLRVQLRNWDGGKVLAAVPVLVTVT